MKKIKYSSLIIAFVMIFSTLTGCGNEVDYTADTTDKNYITSKETFVEKMDELIDLSLYEDLDEDEGTLSTYTYELKDDDKNDCELNRKILLGDGTEFTFPISVKELENLGWTVTNGGDTELKANHFIFGVTVENAEGKVLKLSVINTTQETLLAKECTIFSVETKQFKDYTDAAEKEEVAINFSVCDSLNNASNLEDIIEVLGNPDSVECTLRSGYEEGYTRSEITIVYENEDYTDIEFVLSGNGNYIKSMSYGVNASSLLK